MHMLYEFIWMFLVFGLAVMAVTGLFTYRIVKQVRRVRRAEMQYREELAAHYRNLDSAAGAN